MAKNNPTRRSKPVEVEEVQTVTESPAESTEVKLEPKVKRIAEVTAEKPPTPLRSAVAELVEGSTYELHGVRFIARRPVVVTDQRLLSLLAVNSRFKLTDVEGGKR